MDEQQVVPNIHPELYIIVPLIGLFLASVCVGLRFYVRAIMLKAFGVDDWALAAAYFVFAVHVFIFVGYGTVVMQRGLENAEITLVELLEFQGLAYGLDQVLVKIALATFFLNILHRQTWQRMVIIGSTILFTLFTTCFVFVVLFQCGDPLSSLTDPNAVCLSIPHLQIVTYVSVIFNAVMDWLMVLLPITVVYKSLMTSRMKNSVIFLLMLGVLGSVISIVRVATVHKGVFEGTLESFNTVTPFLFLAQWENCTGIIAVSLAALRPLARKVMKGSSQAETNWTKESGQLGYKMQKSSNSFANGLTYQSSPKTGIAVARTYEVLH